jgi:uroporphyrinogen-III synthase
MSKLLITAELDEVSELLQEMSDTPTDLLHIPLEQYEYHQDDDQNSALLQQIDTFQFVVYGGLRNARYFLTWINNSGIKDEILKKVHLVMNEPEANYLEENDVPAILPKEGARPIDIMEFLLRITLNGAVLYPCAEGSSEEVPGLLEELEMPVAEFTICRSVPFDKNDIYAKREELEKAQPDVILFHSRGSVIRTRAAFPDLDISSKQIIAASAGVAHKLRQEGLEPNEVASGNWESVKHIIKEL